MLYRLVQDVSMCNASVSGMLLKMSGVCMVKTDCGRSALPLLSFCSDRQGMSKKLLVIGIVYTATRVQLLHTALLIDCMHADRIVQKPLACF